jgi:hypothetical protein
VNLYFIVQMSAIFIDWFIARELGLEREHEVGENDGGGPIAEGGKFPSAMFLIDQRRRTDVASC